MSFRSFLKTKDRNYYNTFLIFSEEITPIISSVEIIFSELTRHGPSHNRALEAIAFDLLKKDVIEKLTSIDIFVILCSLWLHDLGMGQIDEIEKLEKSKPEYIEKLVSYQRLGLPECVCWRDYVRLNHYKFCPFLAEKYFKNKVSPFIYEWIGTIAKSHGEQNIHNQELWPKKVAVGDHKHIQAPLIAVLLRIADILHFNYERAPEYMLEHRNISNSNSIAHWKAHQVSADFTISDDICFFDGITSDDEAYWFALQFIRTMDEEVSYCKQKVLPNLDIPFSSPLTFSRVENRIKPKNFMVGQEPVTIKVDTPSMLGGLLNDSLYSGKPTWFREILQNSFDACRDRKELDIHSNPLLLIKVNTSEEVIEFYDSGSGMTPEIIENFLLIAGASYWNSDEYKSSKKKVGHVGTFGIGFMSLFAVSESIEIVSLHFNNCDAIKYYIRNPHRIVRIEQCHLDEPGTRIIVKLKKSTLLKHDVIELFDKICSYPEFPVTLSIDGIIERKFNKPKYPTIRDSDLKLEKRSAPSTDVKLLKKDITKFGIRGDFYLPKVYLKSLDSYLPDYRNWIKSAGYEFKSESKIIYGGINYPRLHALNLTSGFTHIPSFGCLRLSICPNVYPLNMNLARDNFISGSGTNLLHREIITILDDILSKDILHELKNKQDVFQRSTIVSRFSNTMLNLWLGQVPTLNNVLSGNAFAKLNRIESTPWKNLSKIMKAELKFICIDYQGKKHILSLKDLLEDILIFAICQSNKAISNKLVHTIFNYNKNALLLLGIPDLNFGIIELRHWASEEYLIPIDSFNRCAYGLRLNSNMSPFGFFPRELDHICLPVASGPSNFAVLDYRDLMAEVKLSPTGNTDIIGVLNRKNIKISLVINKLKVYKEFYKYRRELGKITISLKDALILGKDNIYNRGNVRKLIESLNSLASTLALGDNLFLEDDFPSYFDGKNVTPFGRFALSDFTLNVLKEVEKYDVYHPKLS